MMDDECSSWPSCESLLCFSKGRSCLSRGKSCPSRGKSCPSRRKRQEKSLSVKCSCHCARLSILHSHPISPRCSVSFYPQFTSPSTCSPHSLLSAIHSPRHNPPSCSLSVPPFPLESPTAPLTPHCTKPDASFLFTHHPPTTSAFKRLTREFPRRLRKI